ncbi:MAG TPA: DNA repair protein RecN [Kiloniellales bacterium]|nr:DNA repair protein RecN [Kiloniellales bacterium]
MLVQLSVRDVVLIDRLDLSFGDGLCVLTGETGAGKSILLDALGLALGYRADAGLVRPGAERAAVTASFTIEPGHPAVSLLAEQGLDGEDAVIVLRRVLGADGRSRAFVNDQPVSVGLLRQLGESLVEIQGQFEQRGLLDPATHRQLLDEYAGLADDTAKMAELWRSWRAALEQRRVAADALDRARRDEAFLRHAVEELDALEPEPGEERSLAEERSFLLNAGRLAEALAAALAALTAEEGAGAESALGNAHRALGKVADKAGERLDPALAAIDRALVETEEAVAQLQSLGADLESDSGRLEAVEERLFALRELARKHDVAVEALPALRTRLAERLTEIDDGGARLQALDRAAAEARKAYCEAAERVGAARRKAAKALDRAVERELPPLKLDKARFRTVIDPLPESDWGPNGLDRIAFAATTNPGTPAGPLAKIASGGELARFLLAIRVVLAEVGARRTLVFDEVDSGIGGATAHAVGERLARLTRDRQVLVVTHSPQVGARGTHHWRVHKEAAGRTVTTRVSALDAAERREEIARMLSGAEVTEEARAAARRLIEAEAR